MNRRSIALAAALMAGLTGGVGAALPVASAATTATVTKQVKAGISLNVRTGPNTSSKSVGKLAGGTKVTGSVSGSWFKIASGPYAGKYVSAAYLVAAASPAPKAFNDATVTPATGQKVGWVMADPAVEGSYANVRSAASTTASITGTYGAHVRVVGTPVGDGTWWKVSGGYVNSATLTSDTSDPSTINAKIPLDKLCVIPSAYYSQLPPGVIGYGYTTATKRYIQCKALPSLVALESAYKAHFGSYAGIDNAYRTWAEQSYWYGIYHPIHVAVAAPGQSNHGYGLAIDFQATYKDHPFYQFKKNHPGYLWLFDNAGKYGFNNPYRYATIPDDVHWNFVG